MKLWLLVMFVHGHTFVLDYGLTLDDCISMKAENPALFCAMEDR